MAEVISRSNLVQVRYIAFALCLILSLPSAAFAQLDGQSDEYLQGYRTTFSTKDHPKAKSIHLNIDYPSSWAASESKRPNVVQSFVSNSGRGLEHFLVVVKDLKLPGDMLLSDQDRKDFLSQQGLRALIPGGATFVNAETATIEAVPAGILEYELTGDRAGIPILIRIWEINFFIEGVFVKVAFSVAGLPSSRDDVSRRMNRFRPLFRLIANSIVLPDKWSGDLTGSSRQVSKISSEVDMDAGGENLGAIAQLGPLLLIGLIWLAFLWPITRRKGKSLWWLLAMLVPVIGVGVVMWIVSLPDKDILDRLAKLEGASDPSG